MIIVPIIVAYSIIGHGVYGPFLKEYSTFYDSFQSVLKFIIGDCKLLEMIDINPLWTFIFVISLSMLIIYLIISSFSAILIDAYDTIIISQGFPDDEDDIKWTVKVAILWMLDIIPNKYLLKINLDKNSKK